MLRNREAQHPPYNTKPTRFFFLSLHERQYRTTLLLLRTNRYQNKSYLHKHRLYHTSLKVTEFPPPNLRVETSLNHFRHGLLRRGVLVNSQIIACLRTHRSLLCLNRLEFEMAQSPRHLKVHASHVLTLLQKRGFLFRSQAKLGSLLLSWTLRPVPLMLTLPLDLWESIAKAPSDRQSRLRPNREAAQRLI